MFKVNVVYKDDQGETIKTDQRDVDITFEMELTPADIAAAEAAEKTVDDLVEEQILTELQTTLATAQVTPTVARSIRAGITPGPAFQEPEMGDEPGEGEAAPSFTEQG